MGREGVGTLSSFKKKIKKLLGGTWTGFSYLTGTSYHQFV